MKGIVFDLLQQTVTSRYGADTWDLLLDEAGLDGAYTAVGSYPDEQFMALVGAGALVLKMSPDELTCWFARECVPVLVGRYATFFTPHTTTRSFLLTLNEVIHPEVRKLFPGAYAPSFDFTDLPNGGLALGYYSPRKLCSFAEGLIDGTAAHFGEAVQITHSSCTKRGDATCTIEVRFLGKA